MTAKPDTAAEVLADIDKLIAQNPLHDVSIGGFKTYLGHLIDFRDRLKRAMSAQGEAVRPAGYVCDFDPADTMEYTFYPLAAGESIPHGCTAMYTHHAPAPATHPDDLAVDRFAAAMKEKLAAARAKGRGGWDDKEDLEAHLSNLLRSHVEKGDPRDVANFCCFLWNRGESIQPAPARVTEEMVERGWKAFVMSFGDIATPDEYLNHCTVNEMAELKKAIGAALSAALED